MTHRTCSACGAPLHGDVCSFCGAENVATRAVPATPTQQPAPRAFEAAPIAPQPNKGNIVALIAGLAMVPVLATFAFVMAVRAPSAPNVVVPNISIPAIPTVVGTKSTRTPMSDLHTTRITWQRETPIDAPGVVGTLARFDAMANWGWAASVGHAWYEDAEITSVRIDPVDPDGTINLEAKEAEVSYTMRSEQCKRAEDARAQTERNFEKASCSLVLTLSAEGPSVRMELVPNGYKPLTKPTCTIGQLFPALGAKLEKRPTYAVDLENSGSGARFSVRSGRGSASMERSPSMDLNFCK